LAATASNLNRRRAHVTLRAALASAMVALALGMIPAGARADGDPASDVLLSQSVFLPSDAGGSREQQGKLDALLSEAHRAGFPIRVAIIASAYDLGAVTPLWHNPRAYASFLGIELSDVYRHPLLVVMPNGMGVNWPGHSSAAAYRLLAGVRANPGVGLVAAAQMAVRGMVAAAGIKIAPLQHAATAASTSAGSDRNQLLEKIVAAIAALVLVAAIVIAIRGRPRPRAATAALVGETGAFPIRLRWAVPGGVALCCLAIGAPILIVTQLRQNNANANVAPEKAPFTWAAGARRAPKFRLTDQAGHPVSLAADRGRPVILTFVDPLCRNLCPLAAHVLNQASNELPADQRPAIIAVSVDIYADSHADLEQDFSRWHLVPQWRWAIGKPKQLASVWRQYKVGVSVTTKRISRTTVHFITHDELAYIIDPNGYERALFVWPYWPQDVVHVLKQLSRS
jgi:cytochrome oxidase Cu insertion factor (SCO1/SenC/PrrC family)